MMVKTHPPSPLLTKRILTNHYWLGTTKANMGGGGGGGGGVYHAYGHCCPIDKQQQNYYN
jgi:hypothetical protein